MYSNTSIIFLGESDSDGIKRQSDIFHALIGVCYLANANWFQGRFAGDAACVMDRAITNMMMVFCNVCGTWFLRCQHPGGVQNGTTPQRLCGGCKPSKMIGHRNCCESKVSSCQLGIIIYLLYGGEYRTFVTSNVGFATICSRLALQQKRSRADVKWRPSIIKLLLRRYPGIRSSQEAWVAGLWSNNFIVYLRFRHRASTTVTASDNARIVTFNPRGRRADFSRSSDLHSSLGRFVALDDLVLFLFCSQRWAFVCYHGMSGAWVATDAIIWNDC